MTPSEDSERLLHIVIPTMEGWLPPERAIEMYRLVRAEKPRTVVEIGVFAGRGLIAHGLALRDNGGGQIYGIDPWERTACLEDEQRQEHTDWWGKVDLHKMHQLCMEAIWNHHLEDYITVIRARAERCVAIIPKIDILYIDGNHSERASCRDVQLYLPLVNAGGHIWFDDSDWPSTAKAVAILSAKCKLIKDGTNHRLYQKTGA